MTKTTLFFKNFIFIFLLNTILISAQDAIKIIDKFENYSEAPRELTYVHLNKSTLIKGEMLGYSVYVFDKFDKGPSTGTTNMYCVIKDSTDTIIKKKLIMIKKGLAHNVFNIDSTFTSGTYKFSAYTNYTLNFDEPNYFETTFTVIDPKVETQIEKKSYAANYKIQVLPEGGHLIANTQNTIAIIVKDSKGLGLKNTTGQIIDNESTVVSEFKLDAAGIAKTILLPQKNKSYQVTIPNESGSNITLNISDIDYFGFNMSLAELRETIILTFRTNEATLPNINKENYKLTIHNGSKIVTSMLKFEDKLETSVVIKKDMLFEGMNVLTVFNSKDTPILERLYFNHGGITTAKFESLKTVKKINDSLHIRLKLNSAVDLSKIQNISLSALPTETKSYNFNTTILSKLYLEPYVNSYIENAAYYFSSTNAKVSYDLDNLLLSQGWSSYNWNKVFNTPPVVRRPFEYGITSVVNVNDKEKVGTYNSIPLKNNTTEIFVLGDNDTSFYQTGLFPMENEAYKISKSGKGKDSKKPNLYVTFNPSDFPENRLNSQKEILQNANSISYLATDYSLIDPSWKADGIEKLDEVVVLANKEKTRIEEIEKKYFGRVHVITEVMRRSAITLNNYLPTINAPTQEIRGELFIRLRGQIPTVYLDGVRLSDFNILYNFSMELVDYIVIDPIGTGEGLSGAGAGAGSTTFGDDGSGGGSGGGGGVIRIFTGPELNNSYKKNNLISEHEFPLTFSESKKYYTPNYQVYNTDFYNDYGTIAWLPNLKVDSEGYINFKVYNTGLEALNLYIEGVVNDKAFISETKTIELNN